MKKKHTVSEFEQRCAGAGLWNANEDSENETEVEEKDTDISTYVFGGSE